VRSERGKGQVKRKAVARPDEDLECVAAAILENEQITAERIALENRPHHARERVDPLAAIHGFDGQKGVLERGFLV